MDGGDGRASSSPAGTYLIRGRGGAGRARTPDLLVRRGGHPSAPCRGGDGDRLGRHRIPGHGRERRAIGEIGLDFFRNLLAPAEAQREALARQLEMAATAGKPVLVHDRDAHDEVEHAPASHWAGPGRSAAARRAACFSGDGAMARRLAAGGFLVSFALPLTFRSATGPREAAAALAPESSSVETDAPWLGPGPDRRNEPTRRSASRPSWLGCVGATPRRWPARWLRRSTASCSTGRGTLARNVHERGSNEDARVVAVMSPHAGRTAEP